MHPIDVLEQHGGTLSVEYVALRDILPGEEDAANTGDKICLEGGEAEVIGDGGVHVVDGVIILEDGGAVAYDGGVDVVIPGQGINPSDDHPDGGIHTSPDGSGSIFFGVNDSWRNATTTETTDSHNPAKANVYAGTIHVVGQFDLNEVLGVGSHEISDNIDGDVTEGNNTGKNPKGVEGDDTDKKGCGGANTVPGSGNAGWVVAGLGLLGLRRKR